MSVTVESWMSRSPVTIEPEAPALAALDLMVDAGIRHLPVVNAQRQLVGVVSLGDLRAALPFAFTLRDPLEPEERELAREYAVGELMTHSPFTVAADASLQDSALQLAERRIGCLPVLDGSGKLVGLLSETDALRALAAILTGQTLPPRERIEELGTLVRDLRTERGRIARQLGQHVEVERELSAEQHDLPMDAPERGTDLQQIEVSEQLADLAARRLDALDRALDRAATQRLGICEGCRDPIPVARLRALPGTNLCIDCARAFESGGAVARSRVGRLGTETGSGEVRTGELVYTSAGEGRLLRLAPFGTCGLCGEVEGRYDEREDAIACTSPGCENLLTDVEELAVVELADETISVRPEKLRPVNSSPYD
jgi:CBS domain-containing protein